MRRRKQIRLKGYDYSNAGSYFLTICTNNRLEIFGKIVNDEMICNENGEIVKSCWGELPSHYQNIILDEFQVMPNHVHGIIIIIDAPIVGSRRAPTLLQCIKKHTLGNIVGSFKSAVTKRINELHHTSGEHIWQYRFHDHIIRNERSLNRIREYIGTNPERWLWDKKNSLL